MEEQAKREGRMVVESIDAIRAGIESGPGVPAEDVFDRLENKYASMVQSENAEAGRSVTASMRDEVRRLPQKLRRTLTWDRGSGWHATMGFRFSRTIELQMFP